MKKFLLLFILILGCQNLKDTENRTFKLTMMETKDISFVSNSFAPTRPKKENRQLEEIKKIPSDYKLLGIYQVDLQSSYKLSKYVLSDEKQKIDFVNDFGLYYLKYIEKISKIESYDCIFSACEVENEKGDKFFIFDENNDEDFTNDPIADFESLKSDFIEGKNIRLETATRPIMISIFNGISVVDSVLNFSVIKRYEPDYRGLYFAPSSQPSGYITLSGKKYFISLVKLLAGIELMPVDFIWIDINNNKRLDMGIDHYSQMLVPFTIDGVSYRISKVHPFGKEILIENQDKTKFPPISVGLQAPDFQFTDSDSTKILFATLGNDYKLLDFWSCNSMYCNKQLLELNDKYGSKLNIIVVPWHPTSMRRLDVKSLSKLEQISKIVSGDDIKKLKYLYQIGSEHHYVLISPSGKIVFKDKFAFEKIDKFVSEIIQ